MEASLSSKVTVEYHDPSGVFPLISKDLASRLPLRNLNWKSPTRPLRSIGALHVEFVPDAATAAKNEKNAQLQRLDSTGSAGDVSSTTGKERRHQIPGLLQTPYLKIYLLRCDDKDAYKATSRQLLRDWIRENTPTTQSSSQVNKTENHDACEWLILHVVIPDTVAASEPRWTAASKKDPDELVERPQSTAKWPGKSTRTVLDKIRADFNATSKSAPERVAQLRLQKKDVPPQVLPQTPVPSQYTETPQEQDNAWQDLVSKFKTLILMSFDLRVSQYEDDLREKDTQRSLPGWNFCTFFTLKEGLARGFESVGLVEDALAIYDELSAGLDTAVRENVSGGDVTQSTFLGDMKQYADALRQALDSPSDAEKTNKQIQDLFGQPLDLTRTDYRGGIVKNTISLFDFHLYIFARQRTLLLRLAAGLAPAQQRRPQSSQAANKDDNFAFSAEVCRRAAAFAATDSRVLRKSLHVGSTNASSPSSQFDLLVDNVVSSWTYAVLDQVLSETASEKLQHPGASSEGLSAAPQRHGPGGRKEGGAFNFPQGANTHPNRSSSLQRSSSGSGGGNGGPPPPQVIYENERFSKSNLSSVASTPVQAGSGLTSLAAGRAELIMMQRKIVETVAERKAWLTGWSALVKASALTEVDLGNDEATDDATPAYSEAPSQIENVSELLLSPALSSALASIEAFRSAYEQLTSSALTHFNMAKHTKSSDMITSDLAVLRYQMGDYAQAATLFQKSSHSYLQGNWTYVHAEMLRAYAKCLKELHRKDEYMRVMLSLLSKVIVRQRARSLPLVKYTTLDPSLAWHDDEAVDVSGILADLSIFSEVMPYNFTTPLLDFFADVHVNAEVLHYEDKDGFSLNVQFRHLLEDSLELDRVRLRLVHSSDAGQEIWLEAHEKVELERGLVKLRLHSDITTYGVYLIDKLVLDTKKLRFIHEFQPKPKATPLGITSPSNVEHHTLTPKGPSILVYPNGSAFDASAELTNKLHVDKLRAIVVNIDSGRNDIQNLELRVRAASAGLRLHTGDSIVIKGTTDLDTSQGGLFRTGAVGANTKLQISLPYSLEHSLNEVTVKLEAHYTTGSGSFIFLSTCTIPVELPLDVDVHDIFKAENLFSRFSIRTTNSIPLQVMNVQLKDSVSYAVQSLPCPPLMTVFEKQPASLTYKITKKSVDKEMKIDKKDAALAMTVQYLCIGDQILNRITSIFRDALGESPFAHLKRLLLPILRSGVQSHQLALQFERAVLLRELQLPSYETVGWDNAIVTLPIAIRDSLSDWVRAWHKRNKHISFDPTASSSTATNDKSEDESEIRAITITVDVPTIDVIHTASLTLLESSTKSSSTGGGGGHSTIITSTLGTPLPAELRITHTRRWASPSSSSAAAAKNRQLRFVYSLRDSAENWLIGGQRRAHFAFGSSTTTSEDNDDGDKVDEEEEAEVKTFSIILIPLKCGMHLLPTIDISPVAALSTTEEPASSGLWSSVNRSSIDASSSASAVVASSSPALGSSLSASGGKSHMHVPAQTQTATTAAAPVCTCETDVLSAGTMVKVVKDARTTSVTVGGGSALSGDVALLGPPGRGSVDERGRGSTDTRISGLVGGA